MFASGLLAVLAAASGSATTVSFDAATHKVTISSTDTNSGGDVQSVAAGAGLSGGGTSGNIILAADYTRVQARVGTTCGAGTYLRAIAQDAAWV